MFCSLLSLAVVSLAVSASEIQNVQINAVENSLRSIQAADCGYGSSDLSSLTSGTDLQTSDVTFDYYMNMCGVVNNAACSSGKPNVMVCQNVQPNRGTGLYALAYSGGGVWSYYNGAAAAGLSVVYTNGDGGCYNPDADKTEGRQLTINFPCAKTQDTTFTISTEAIDPCHYTIVFSTPAACPGSADSSSSSGLSGGWIFIIILIVLSFVYVIAGCIYKAKMQGALGIERCPNIDFWRDLPKLIKEGAQFTFKKLRGLCGGGSSSPATYESM